MATDKPRFTITVDEELYKLIDDFKFQNRCKNQTQAVITLIESGLETMQLKTTTEEDKPELKFSAKEIDLIEKYRSLNKIGMEKANGYIEDLLDSPKYRIPDNLPMPDLNKIKERFDPQIKAFRKNQSGLVKK